MAYSLNEIEVMGKRAARGAGYHWGHAEEAGKAVRWLASHDLPGPEMLAALLLINDGKPYRDIAPDLIDGVWRVRQGALCPLIAGTVLCDRADELSGGHIFELGLTAHPLFLAPFVAAIAKQTGSIMEVSWPGVTINLSPDGIIVEGAADALFAETIETVRCHSSEVTQPVSSDRLPVRAVDDQIWGQLDIFAQRTFAPATEASRLAGAGAGLSDND